MCKRLGIYSLKSSEHKRRRGYEYECRWKHEYEHEHKSKYDYERRWEQKHESRWEVNENENENKMCKHLARCIYLESFGT